MGEIESGSEDAGEGRFPELVGGEREARGRIAEGVAFISEEERKLDPIPSVKGQSIPSAPREAAPNPFAILAELSSDQYRRL